MIKQEARDVLGIMKTADGGCFVCVSELFESFIYQFPKFRKLAEEIYQKEYDEKHLGMEEQEYKNFRKWLKEEK